MWRESRVQEVRMFSVESKEVVELRGRRGEPSEQSCERQQQREKQKTKMRRKMRKRKNLKTTIRM